MNMPTANAVADAMEHGYIVTSEDLLDADIAEQAAADALKDAGITVIDGREHLTNAKGHLVPVAMVKDSDKLEDQTVRKIIGYAAPLSAQVARFRQHTFDDIDALIALMDEKYGVKKGGQKGNLTLMSFDGLMKVQAKIADNISFGPELQSAKALIDEFLMEKTSDSLPEIKTLIDHAFSVEREGQINRGALLGLRRLNITDVRWVSAMEAITNSIRIVGTKRYINIYRRADVRDGWTPIVIDVASS